MPIPKFIVSFFEKYSQRTHKTIYSFVLLFILCELGERVRIRFEEIDNEINNMNWYLYPIKIQRMLPTMQMMSQQDVQLTAFGNFPCSRDNFKRVIKF